VLDHFRHIVDSAGGGNCQTLINDALVAHIQQQSMLAAVRRVVREEIAKVIAPVAPVVRSRRHGAGNDRHPPILPGGLTHVKAGSEATFFAVQCGLIG